MPDFDGIEAMRQIHEKPELPVVILTHADPGVEKKARQAGASGFLAKGTALEDIVIVLHEAAERLLEAQAHKLGRSVGRAVEREQHDLSNARRVGEQHQESVDPDPQPAPPAASRARGPEGSPRRTGGSPPHPPPGPSVGTNFARCSSGS